MQYRKKPVVIEAVQWNGSNYDEVCELLQGGDAERTISYGTETDYLEVNTLEGVMKANKGDYVIRGVKGEIYPCKPDIFEATYDKVTI